MSGLKIASSKTLANVGFGDLKDLNKKPDHSDRVFLFLRSSGRNAGVSGKA